MKGFCALGLALGRWNTSKPSPRIHLPPARSGYPQHKVERGKGKVSEGARMTKALTIGGTGKEGGMLTAGVDKRLDS